jgi:hypothetical protein
MNAWKNLDRGLEYLFLRLYAKNLARSFRSEPENASTDTEIQISTMVSMAIFAVVLIVGSVLFPVYLQRLMNGGDWSIALVMAVVVAVVYGIHRRFGSYQDTPEIARETYASRDHRRSSIIYWSVIVGWLIVAILTLGHFRR